VGWTSQSQVNTYPGVHVALFNASGTQGFVACAILRKLTGQRCHLCIGKMPSVDSTKLSIEKTAMMIKMRAMIVFICLSIIARTVQEAESRGGDKTQ
jgi:hypothetical protein